MAEERPRIRRPTPPEERTGYRSGDPGFHLPEGGSAAGRKPDGTADDAPVSCDLCGAQMIEHHCKLSCPQCGYQRDCSDP